MGTQALSPWAPNYLGLWRSPSAPKVRPRFLGPPGFTNPPNSRLSQTSAMGVGTSGGEGRWHAGVTALDKAWSCFLPPRPFLQARKHKGWQAPHSSPETWQFISVSGPPVSTESVQEGWQQLAWRGGAPAPSRVQLLPCPNPTCQARLHCRVRGDIGMKEGGVGGQLVRTPREGPSLPTSSPRA